MEPVTTYIGFKLGLGLALKALATAAVVVITLSILTFERIKNWFRERTQLYEADKANVAFSLQERLANNRFKTVYGVFNTRRNAILDAETVISEEVDGKLTRLHRQDDLVVYQ